MTGNVNYLWKSPQRAIQDDAEAVRQEKQADQNLIRIAEQFDKKKLDEELRKYESNTSSVRAFSILLK